jgi:hypothetical protein
MDLKTSLVLLVKSLVFGHIFLQRKMALRETHTIELEIRKIEAEAKLATAKANADREAYEAETRRLVALGNSGPGLSREQIQPVVIQLLKEMLADDGPTIAADVEDLAAPGEGGTPIDPEADAAAQEGAEPPVEAPEGQEMPQEGQEEQPPVEGAQQADDGKWYVADPDRPGKYLQVGE